MSDRTKAAGSKDPAISGSEGRGGGFTLSRWSQRKRAVARGEAVVASPDAEVAASETRPDAPDTSVAQPSAASGRQPAATLPLTANAVAQEEAPLPLLESLTFDSDFSVFMNGKVDESVRRAALRTLLRDPRFNVMDGLDTYIDDYTIPSPISPSMIAQLHHCIEALNPVFAEDAATAVGVAQSGQAANAPTVITDATSEAGVDGNATSTELSRKMQTSTVVSGDTTNLPVESLSDAVAATSISDTASTHQQSAPAAKHRAKS